MTYKLYSWLKPFFANFDKSYNLVYISYTITLVGRLISSHNNVNSFHCRVSIFVFIIRLSRISGYVVNLELARLARYTNPTMPDLTVLSIAIYESMRVYSYVQKPTTAFVCAYKWISAIWALKLVGTAVLICIWYPCNWRLPHAMEGISRPPTNTFTYVKATRAPNTYNHTAIRLIDSYIYITDLKEIIGPDKLWDNS